MQFADVAMRLGVIIIKELFLSEKERTIPSVSKGGIAGICLCPLLKRSQLIVFFLLRR